MPVRLRLVVAYDGTSFAGWQSQPGGNGIQDHLERAFSQVTGERVRIHGAGRTDAGVHALAQTAHVDLVRKKLDAKRWPAALNAHLPPVVRVLRCSVAKADFHARYSAKGKVYRYRIYCGAVLPPLEFNRAWHVTAPLDVGRMRDAAAKLAGRHDFASFAANRGKPEDTTRTIHSVRVSGRPPLIVVEFEGSGFLYKMVRLMAGALVQCGTGRLSGRDIEILLAKPSKTGSRFVAPAHGLFLVRARY